ncbi:MAG TPA: hypothetical protein VI893_08200 [Thermoplasmata archaeon]|nr:hypothetical protein [Thermoplasmata archaeon]
MPTCHSCGNSGELVVEFTCHSCQRPGCGACATGWKYLYLDNRTDRVLCTPACYNQWFWKWMDDYREKGGQKLSWMDGMVPDVRQAFDGWLPAAHERAGDLTAALALYEQRGMAQDAARVRSAYGSQKAQLIDAARRTGRSLGLTCPRCRSISLVPPNATPETYAKCGRCGAVHDDTTVVNMLRQTLSQIPGAPRQ